MVVRGLEISTTTLYTPGGHARRLWTLFIIKTPQALNYYAHMFAETGRHQLHNRVFCSLDCMREAARDSASNSVTMSFMNIFDFAGIQTKQVSTGSQNAGMKIVKHEAIPRQQML